MMYIRLGRTRKNIKSAKRVALRVVMIRCRLAHAAISPTSSIGRAALAG